DLDGSKILCDAGNEGPAARLLRVLHCVAHLRQSASRRRQTVCSIAIEPGWEGNPARLSGDREEHGVSGPPPRAPGLVARDLRRRAGRVLHRQIETCDVAKSGLLLPAGIWFMIEAQWQDGYAGHRYLRNLIERILEPSLFIRASLNAATEWKGEHELGRGALSFVMAIPSRTSLCLADKNPVWRAAPGA